MAVLTTRRRFSNVAPQATLLAPLNASATTFGISTGTGFPAVPFTVALDYQSAGEEVILVTGLSGTTVTGCTRGYDGTTAQTHATGALFVHTGVAADYNEASDHTSSTAAHGTVGAHVGTTDAQTLTNKTISSSLGLATATDPAAKLQAFTSGVADLIAAYASNGSTLVFEVRRGGDVRIILNDSAQVGLIVQGAVSQATDLLRLLNSAAAVLLATNQAGRVTQKPSDLAGAAYKYVPPSAGAGQFLAVRNTGDTADLLAITTAGAITALSLALSGDINAANAVLTGTLSVTGALSSGAITAPTIVASDVIRRVGYASSQTSTAATGTEVKDTQVGDVAFTVVAGRKYRVVYHGRCESATGSNSIDLRIRDGGASSPTTANTCVASASAGTVAVGGPDFIDTRAEALLVGLSAGTHTIAGFVAETTGSGTVRAGQASAGTRELIVYDEGTV